MVPRLLRSSCALLHCFREFLKLNELEATRTLQMRSAHICILLVLVWPGLAPELHACAYADARF